MSKGIVIKILFLCILCAAVLTGCATSNGLSIFSMQHTAALMLGAPHTKVIKDAEHVLGEPIELNETLEEGLQIRRYKYTEAHDLALYCYKGQFVQLSIVDVGTQEYSGYIPEQSEKLHGFILSKLGDAGEVQLQLIFKK